MIQADILFFSNETKTIGKCELANLLRDVKYITTKMLDLFLTEIDADKTLIIKRKEFIDFMVDKLHIKKDGKILEYHIIVNEIHKNSQEESKEE
jgi:hypothetical protein